MTLADTVRANAQALQGGRTRQELADNAGCSRQQITNLLNGRRRSISVETMRTLARAVGAPPWRLLIPILSETSEYQLILLGHELAHLLSHVADIIRDRYRSRGDGQSVLRAISISQSAREIGAGFGMLLEPDELHSADAADGA